MALGPDGVAGSNILFADNAALTYPNADWAVGGWVRVDARNLSFQYLIGAGAWSGNNSFNCYRNGATDVLYCYLEDGSGNNGPNGNETIAPSLFSVANVDTWQHVILQRSGDNFQCYIDGSSTYNVSEFSGHTTTINPAQVRLAARGSDGASAGDHDYCDWAKWDRALTAGEISAMAAGYSAAFFRESRMWYTPLVRDAVEVDVGIALTLNGTVDIVAGPPIIYPTKQPLIFAAAGAAPAGDVRPRFYHHRHHNQAA